MSYSASDNGCSEAGVHLGGNLYFAGNATAGVRWCELRYLGWSDPLGNLESAPSQPTAGLALLPGGVPSSLV